MYLSQLLIDTGTDPDRPRPGRRWLRDPYRVHQRLCMAFPSAGRRARDPRFLLPFRTDDFPEQARVERGEEAGFLFRVDPRSVGRAIILVQSAAQPDWDYAFHNADHFLAARPETRPYDPGPEVDWTYRFRLRANPTRRRKDDGKRVAWLREEDQLAWLERQASDKGFAVEEARVTTQGWVQASSGRPGDKPPIRLYSVLFEGLLRVTVADQFADALRKGIGSAKGLGFGLLSVARVG